MVQAAEAPVDGMTITSSAGARSLGPGPPRRAETRRIFHHDRHFRSRRRTIYSGGGGAGYQPVRARGVVRTAPPAHGSPVGLCGLIHAGHAEAAAAARSGGRCRQLRQPGPSACSVGAAVARDPARCVDAQDSAGVQPVVKQCGCPGDCGSRPAPVPKATQAAVGHQHGRNRTGTVRRRPPRAVQVFFRSGRQLGQVGATFCRVRSTTAPQQPCWCQLGFAQFAVLHGNSPFAATRTGSVSSVKTTLRCPCARG